MNYSLKWRFFVSKEDTITSRKLSALLEISLKAQIEQNYREVETDNASVHK